LVIALPVYGILLVILVSSFLVFIPIYPLISWRYKLKKLESEYADQATENEGDQAYLAKKQKLWEMLQAIHPGINVPLKDIRTIVFGTDETNKTTEGFILLLEKEGTLSGSYDKITKTFRKSAIETDVAYRTEEELEDENVCLVCRGPISPDEKKRRCPGCRRDFHQSHFDEWVRQHGFCPACKKKIKRIK
jgi:hypothetical protein